MLKEAYKYYNYIYIYDTYNLFSTLNWRLILFTEQ